jgi:hypothetical protein
MSIIFATITTLLSSHFAPNDILIGNSSPDFLIETNS